MSKSKILCLALVVIMLLGVAVPMFSCGPKEPADNTDDTTPAETTTEKPVESTPALETTTPAPETTTPAPETTTPAPETTTPAPETTTTAPETTPVPAEVVEYRWDFDDLKEKNTGTELKVNTKCTNPQYELKDGKLITANRETDFDMGLSFTISHNRAWEIEFKGTPLNSSILFGLDGSAEKSYIYFAPFASSFNSVRVIGENKNDVAVSLKFGSNVYGPTNKGDGVEHIWQIANDPTTSTVSLYMDGALINTQVTGEYEVTCTHLFGRFIDTLTLSYYGEVDYIRVKTTK